MRTINATRKMKVLANAAVAMALALTPFIVVAEQKTVEPNQTVTVEGADIASWVDADISIGAGATLCFSEPVATATFTGKITGSGHFVAKSASESDRPQVFIMNGDATEFTGAFAYSNVYLQVKSPQAVGNVAPITISLKYTGPTSVKSQFFGAAAGQPDYVYQNNIDIYVGINTSSLVVNDRAVLAGSVLHRYGAILGPGTVTGAITTTSNSLYFTGGLHVEGSVKSEFSGGTKLTNNNGVFYLKGKTEGISIFQPIGCNSPVYFDGDNLFGEDVVLQMGVGSSSNSEGLSARIDLNGHSQIFKRCFFTADSGVPEDIRNIGGIDNTGAPATITFANNDEAKFLYGRLDGHLSVTVSGSSMLGFTCPTNTIDGTITASGGTVVLGNNFPNLKKLIACNGGVIDIRATANIHPGRLDVDIDDSSRIKVATGLTMKVRRLIINGVDLPVGRYNKTSPAVDGHFDSFGNGFVEVLGIPGFSMTIR